jgi:hypothetical protein
MLAFLQKNFLVIIRKYIIDRVILNNTKCNTSYGQQVLFAGAVFYELQFIDAD